MLIIAIAWLYVALMMSLGAQSVLAGILGFLGWGPLPLALFWYLFGRRKAPKPSRPKPEKLPQDQSSADQG
jgi:hypothetical protein